jgi:hypothetical protein
MKLVYFCHQDVEAERHRGEIRGAHHKRQQRMITVAADRTMGLAVLAAKKFARSDLFKPTKRPQACEPFPTTQQIVITFK